MLLPPQTEIVLKGTVRLIPNARHRPPALERLAPSHGAREMISHLEGLTNARLNAALGALPGIDPTELVGGVANSTFINAAFAHTRETGNRFNDAKRGAWYAGFDAPTALGEVTFHLTNELRNIGRFENVTDYVALYADFVGPFHDLRGDEWREHDCLCPDVSKGYPAGQVLAEALRAAGSNGVIYPSVRRPGGFCLAAFRPHVVQNVRQGELWRLTWEGAEVPRIETLAGTTR